MSEPGLDLPASQAQGVTLGQQAGAACLVVHDGARAIVIPLDVTAPQGVSVRQGIVDLLTAGCEVSVGCGPSREGRPIGFRTEDR